MTITSSLRFLYIFWGSGLLCDCPKQPRTSYPFYKFFYTIISAKVFPAALLSKQIFASVCRFKSQIAEALRAAGASCLPCK